MLREYLSNIANAIRNKLGSDKTINAQDFIEEIDNVYEAGQSNPKDNVRHNVFGNFISIDNVSEIEHNIPCQLEGKNLFKFKQGQVSGGTASIVEELDNGAICQGVISSDTQHSGWANGWYTFANRATVNLKAGDVVTVSCDYTVLELADGHTMADFTSSLSAKKLGLHLYHTSGGQNNLTGLAKNPPTVLGEPTRLYITYTIKVDGEHYPVFTLNSNKVKVENIQIEYGSTPTNYVPCITDFTGIKVTGSGKNLFNLYGYSTASIANPSATRSLVNGTYGTTISTIEPENSVTVTQSKIGDETTLYNYTNGYFCVGFDYTIPDDTTVTFSFDLDITSNPLNADKFNIMSCGAYAIGYATKVDNRWVVTGKLKTNGDRRYFEIRNAGVSGTFSNFQLELGNTATDYESFNGGIYTSNKAGKIRNMTSVAPNMFIFTDNSEVNINAQYCSYVNPLYPDNYNTGYVEGYDGGKEEEYSRMWDVLQQNGTRTSYASTSGIFGGDRFNFDNFYPKYDIRPVGAATHLFYNWSTTYGVDGTKSFKQRLEECGVVLDTSQATNITSMFNYNRMGEIPTIDCTGLTVASTSVFANSWGGVKTIEKIITKEDVTYTNWFQNASGIENITFEGVIGNNIDFTSCKNLTVKSMNSVIPCLKDYSADTETTHTLTLGSTNLAKLTDAEKAVATEKGWTLA